MTSAEGVEATVETTETAEQRHKRVPYDWRLVKVDHTRYYSEEWLRESKVKACGVFYLYDANRHVHICSFTPSYELFPVASYALAVSDELTDEESEALGNFEVDALASEKAVEYMDVAQVDRLLRKPVGHLPEWEEGEDAEVYYDRVCEELREHYAGNPPWF